MTGRWWVRSGAALLILGGLVGCAADPAPVPPAPGIEDARDASAVDPCTLLAAGELAELGFPAGGTSTTAAEGPRCGWRGEKGELTLTVYAGGDGIATLAANSEPTTTRVRVAGYPALETFTGRGEFCQYDVGISERQVVTAALDAPAPDSCSVLQAVVPMVVEGLPPYSG